MIKHIKKAIFPVIIFLVIVSYPSYTYFFSNEENEKFEIIYLADGKYASNIDWIERIRDDWQATGINLRIFRFAVESPTGELNWNNSPYEVDKALLNIANAGLDIYIRVNFSLWVFSEDDYNFNRNDFHIRSDGSLFLNPYHSVKRPLPNITSKHSRVGMLNFLQILVNHLRSLPREVKEKIKLIVPTLSPDDETEFPHSSYNTITRSVDHSLLTGFSNPEIEAFILFLKTKYETIDQLNEQWGEGAVFRSFDSRQIQIKIYSWDGVKFDKNSADFYVFENGRKDFLDFRRNELKKFIDDCSRIIRLAGFKIGVQFGSIYDNLVEFRGFYDPTPLVENVDMLITDDIPEYHPNFSFSADYSRSLTKYWEWKNYYSNKIRFATETNWPDYADHKPEDLIKYWSLQLRTFYEKGAHCLFVSHWGTIEDHQNTPQNVITGRLFPVYKEWQDTLGLFREAPINKIINEFAYHLACEQGTHFRIESRDIEHYKTDFVHNNGFVVGKVGLRDAFEFPLSRLSRLLKGDINNIAYHGSGDFITSFMILKSPDYLQKQYKKFYQTGTSIFFDKNQLTK